jgi:hypothetical protein
MCQILFFRHKKHLFDCGRELEQLRSIEKVFFMYNVLGSTGIAGGLLFRSLRSLNHLKALTKKPGASPPLSKAGKRTGQSAELPKNYRKNFWM